MYKLLYSESYALGSGYDRFIEWPRFYERARNFKTIDEAWDALEEWRIDSNVGPDHSTLERCAVWLDNKMIEDRDGWRKRKAHPFHTAADVTPPLEPLRGESRGGDHLVIPPFRHMEVHFDHRLGFPSLYNE